ncbi:MAG TPA: hypothetical protein VF054_20570 [Micromonosporaceae bacterium]
MTEPGTPEPLVARELPAAPEPPPGPGVRPPFAAPPSDRDRTRLWIGLGVGALALVVCCVGSLFGLGILAVAGGNELTSQARQVVTDYLDALRAARYDNAYDLLCEPLRQRETEEEFAARMSGGARVVDFTVGTPRVGNEIVVPADVTVASGRRVAQSFTLAQDRSAETRLKICQVTQ